MKRRIIRQLGTLLAAGFVAGLAITAGAPSAGAAYQRMNASVCRIETPASTRSYQVAQNAAYLENTSTTLRDFVCPFVETTSFPNTSISSVVLDVYDGSTTGSVSGKLCSLIQLSNGNVADSPSGAAGSECAFNNVLSFPTVGQTGAATLTLPTVHVGGDPLVLEDGETAYVLVFLPNASRLYSIMINGT